jgi:hypothetical protein
MQELLELLVLGGVAIDGVNWCGSHGGRGQLDRGE